MPMYNRGTMPNNDDSEIAPRVERIEQQIPVEWKGFAGKPMQMTYNTTKVNVFRENADLLLPSGSFTSWAALELRSAIAGEGKHLSDADLKSIVSQEWRTDLTRSIVETRLNRHGSKNGPVVRRSSSGALYIAPQPAQPVHSRATTRGTSSTVNFVLDAIATPELCKKIPTSK
ncbi:hypothetical protein F441_08782 [Phytophthora nicotianae CJ01A1]|uniref:Uncharacterized protein n=4 Tax=Phytophthora nicotianae TaxID=4792 RepID=V9F813_PHYNI|nr:hypothetical protein F443_08801 [Phytophthora nicotianae P1569]ETM46617.1 hypothetical protein L914_08525 [Phytophthora nicotianae]ETO75565.1 hypothetical protein F444_08870 [Phytophthora nicotianae P1976]ETP16663.1 hypothetical protein F441_08782 [Phytophthora nicotianae CJ01A1]